MISLGVCEKICDNCGTEKISTHKGNFKNELLKKTENEIDFFPS